jgi:nitrilase
VKRRTPRHFTAVIAAREKAMRTVKAAAVQMSPVLYSREGTIDRVVQKIDELGQEGVQFATFPETVVP